VLEVGVGEGWNEKWMLPKKKRCLLPFLAFRETQKEREKEKAVPPLGHVSSFTLLPHPHSPSVFSLYSLLPSPRPRPIKASRLPIPESLTSASPAARIAVPVPQRDLQVLGAGRCVPELSK